MKSKIKKEDVVTFPTEYKSELKMFAKTNIFKTLYGENGKPIKSWRMCVSKSGRRYWKKLPHIET